MKVRIDAHGRAVEIECADANVTAKDIIEVALDAWKATTGTDSPGPAYGFSQDRRWSADKTPLANGIGTRNMPLREVDA